MCLIGSFNLGLYLPYNYPIMHNGVTIPRRVFGSHDVWRPTSPRVNVYYPLLLFPRSESIILPHRHFFS